MAALAGRSGCASPGVVGRLDRDGETPQVVSAPREAFTQNTYNRHHSRKPPGVRDASGSLSCDLAGRPLVPRLSGEQARLCGGCRLQVGKERQELNIRSYHERHLERSVREGYSPEEWLIGYLLWYFTGPRPEEAADYLKAELVRAAEVGCFDKFHFAGVEGLHSFDLDEEDEDDDEDDEDDDRTVGEPHPRLHMDDPVGPRIRKGHGWRRGLD